jgi:adenylate cyclase class 2
VSGADRQELEIKLRFPSVAVARQAVAAAGAAPLRPNRLQRDYLLDTPDGALRTRRTLLRVRIEPESAALTLKGPPQPSMMKLREELETMVGDGPLLLRVLQQIGFTVWFRYEKYREEFALHDVIVAIDETPVGTFVEIEGSHDGIGAAAQALGRSPEDYVLDSYRGLFLQKCQELGVPASDMLFDAGKPRLAP